MLIEFHQGLEVTAGVLEIPCVEKRVPPLLHGDIRARDVCVIADETGVVVDCAPEVARDALHPCHLHQCPGLEGFAQKPGFFRGGCNLCLDDVNRALRVPALEAVVRDPQVEDAGQRRQRRVVLEGGTCHHITDVFLGEVMPAPKR